MIYINTYTYTCVCIFFLVMHMLLNAACFIELHCLHSEITAVLSLQQSR